MSEVQVNINLFDTTGAVIQSVTLVDGTLTSTI